MRKKHGRYYTVMFVPDDDAKTFSVRVRRGLVRTIGGFVVLFMCAGVFVLLFMGQTAVRLQLVQSLSEQNAQLRAKNRELLARVGQARRAEVLGEYLGRLAELTSRDSQAQVVRREMFAASVDSGTGQNEAAPVESVLSAAVEVADLTESRTQAVEAASSVPSISPVDGWVTRPFVRSTAGAPAHAALDFAAAEGSPVRATAPGTVVDVGNNQYFGLFVTVRHASGFVTRYGHCQQILVAQGAAVDRGQTIALVGNTGRSTAPHLHYEVLKDGVAVDPAEYMYSSAAF